jgi:amidohydrolase
LPGHAGGNTVARMDDAMRAAADALLPAAVELRRRLHRIPEISFDLPRTQTAVLEALDGHGLRLSTGSALTSVTAVLDGGEPGPTVLLRADMDGLPVPEDTGLPFASEHAGSMHACGHDAHMAMLICAARLLSERRADLAGRVLFMFQPGEESHGGARVMLDEGVLDAAGEPPVAAFAIHQFPLLPSGWVSSKPGPVMASSDILRATLTGRGGHASAPHRALDPVPVAAEAVLALQTYVSRRTDPVVPVVVTIGTINAGTVHNVIPESASMTGTLRTLSEVTRATVKREVASLVEGVAAAHGLAAHVEWEEGYPVVVNDADATAFAMGVAAEVLGPDRVLEMPTPAMASEDFAYVLQRVPGAMLFLGTQPPGVDEPAPLHSNRMMLDEDAMAAGIALFAELALRTLSEGSRP